MVLTRILQLATDAISTPEQGRLELEFLKKMCTSMTPLLLSVASCNIGLHSMTPGPDTVS
jgi:hypothetical protein